MGAFYQLQRLKKDSKELGHYIHKLEKGGNVNKAHRLAKKQDFLRSAISDVESRLRG